MQLSIRNLNSSLSKLKQSKTITLTNKSHHAIEIGRFYRKMKWIRPFQKAETTEIGEFVLSLSDPLGGDSIFVTDEYRNQVCSRNWSVDCCKLFFHRTKWKQPCVVEATLAVVCVSVTKWIDGRISGISYMHPSFYLYALAFLSLFLLQFFLNDF